MAPAGFAGSLVQAVTLWQASVPAAYRWKVQVPGAQYVRSGLTYERVDGFPAHWRGIYDDKGRLMVAICFNVDLGDSWEHADNPEYPQKFSALGLRIGVNYVAYAMTH